VRGKKIYRKKRKIKAATGYGRTEEQISQDRARKVNPTSGGVWDGHPTFVWPVGRGATNRTRRLGKLGLFKQRDDK